MATYAIGDIQGCFDALQALLARIDFVPEEDTLWLAGDLVNRGQQSLEVLRFLMTLPNVVAVLGNHDLHLLALAHGLYPTFKAHTLEALLTAPDRDVLTRWVRHRPFFHQDTTLGYVMSHAGVPAQWAFSEARRYAREVELVLQDDDRYGELLAHMYGNTPDLWDDALTGWDRLRVIINYFTRMRYVHADGSLNFSQTGPIGTQPPDLVPWFNVPRRCAQDKEAIIFGHWAALRGKIDQPRVCSLDGGCAWGNSLIAMRLEDRQRFSVSCEEYI